MGGRRPVASASARPSALRPGASPRRAGSPWPRALNLNLPRRPPQAPGLRAGRALSLGLGAPACGLRPGLRPSAGSLAGGRPCGSAPRPPPVCALCLGSSPPLFCGAGPGSSAAGAGAASPAPQGGGTSAALGRLRPSGFLGIDFLPGLWYNMACQAGVILRGPFGGPFLFPCCAVALRLRRRDPACRGGGFAPPLPVPRPPGRGSARRESWAVPLSVPL